MVGKTIKESNSNSIIGNGITKRWGKEDIQIFRGVAILLVLVHHAMSASKTQSAGVIFDFIFQHICNVHVVIFFIISGYLFEVNIARYMADKKRFLLSKSRRILIPYFVWSALIAAIVNVGLRVGITAPVFQELGFAKWTITEFLVNTAVFANSYLEVLWFLYCLFVIFVVNIFFSKQCVSEKWLIGCMLVIAVIQTVVVPPYMVRKIFLHIFNFSVGRILYKKNLEIKLQSNKALSVAVVVLLFFDLKYYLGISFSFLPIYLQKVYQIVHAFLESICLFIVIQQIWFRCVKKDRSQYMMKGLQLAGNSSFSIYLMHNPWIVAPVCKVLTKVGVPQTITVLLAVVLGCVIPSCLTKLIEKNQYLAEALLGEKTKHKCGIRRKSE